MKPGQLIGYNLKNIFLENSYTICGTDTIPRFFPEKPKLNISHTKYVVQKLFTDPIMKNQN